MKRHMLFTLAFVLGPTASLFAQVPAVPGAPAPSVTQVSPGGGPQQAANVTVSNKCCSIWDFLGVGQVAKFVGGTVCKTQIAVAFNTALKPLAGALGLGPSITASQFANAPTDTPQGLAAKLKAEEAKVPAKVQAIKFLATLDCHCYPEIVDVLLGSLDDCAEVVRYEALKALNGQCHKGCRKPQGNCPCECSTCKCQKKVIARLNDLLLARDEFGCLMERSGRIRSLASTMIEDCLAKHQPPPEIEEPPPAAPVPTRPDPTPQIRPEGTVPTRPDPAPNLRPVTPPPVNGSPTAARSFVPNQLASASANLSRQPAPAQVERQMVEQDGEYIVGAVNQVPERTRTPKPAPRRKHLFGEIFGYNQ